ncbi:putative exo-beta-1,3-glucanase [Delphinella strobiligena]|nr:putative exo-beta-1,3-glucanase [Delphinella strobiligena]
MSVEGIVLRMLFCIFIFALLSSFASTITSNPVHAVSNHENNLNVDFRVQNAFKQVVSGTKNTWNKYAEQQAPQPELKADASTFWYESIAHNGESPFIPNGATWKVFRNVVADYGADSSGNLDATKAIQKAIDTGNSFANRTTNSLGTTGQPAVVYLPSGTYTISSPLQLYVGTVLMGNPLNPPIIKASTGFNGNTMIYGKDPHHDSTINFYLAIKNLVVDSTAVDPATTLTLLDWSVSQATQLTNIVFQMPNYSIGHTGIAMPEGGSGTMMGDLTFNGGVIGLNMNNQQYEGKSLTFNGCTTGILVSHCFDCVFTNCSFMNGATGLDMTGSSVGSVVLLDSTASSVGTVVNTYSETTGDHTLIIENFVKGSGVGSVVSASGSSILTTSVTDTWVYGNAYVAGGPSSGSHQTGTVYKTNRASSLLSNGKYLTIAPPTYASTAVSGFINVKSVSGSPVYGDGVTDDTANLKTIIAQYASSKVLFFPQGTYIVSDTLLFPAGSKVVGEAWSAISALGSKFYNPSSPVPMVKVGNAGDVGVAQFSDMLFTVADVLQGCILLEVNIAGKTPGDVGFWNTHFRVGGAAGSKVQTNCGGTPASCPAAFALMHLKSSSSAYIENMWGWTADHDLDGGHGQTIATGRGFLIEATSATWLHGTASEHNALYQYNFNNAANIFVGMQQSETAYWQGVGSPSLAPAPWSVQTSYDDPTFTNCASGDAQCRMGWSARVYGSSNLSFYGAGFWTFFNDNDGACQVQGSICQSNAISVDSTTGLEWFGINTKSTTNVVDSDGAALVTLSNNPGGAGGFGPAGACVGAFLTFA